MRHDPHPASADLAYRSATDLAPSAAAIGWLKPQIEAVGPDAPPDPEAEDELLDWLAHRVEEQP